MPRTIEEIVKTAAEWWGNAVSYPRFDNGDTSKTGILTLMMASNLVEPVSQEKRSLCQGTYDHDKEDDGR